MSVIFNFYLWLHDKIWRLHIGRYHSLFMIIQEQSFPTQRKQVQQKQEAKHSEHYHHHPSSNFEYHQL